MMGNAREPSPFGDGNDDIPTHILLIRSPAVVERALARSGLKHLRVADVIGRLSVTRPEAAVKVLEIGFPAETPEVATRVVDSVVESYRKFLEENYQEKTTDVTTLIAKVRDDLSKELNDLERRYVEYRKQHPGLTVTDDGRSLLARRAEQWDAEANKEALLGLRLQAQLALSQKRSARGEDPGAITGALKLLGGVETPAGDRAGGMEWDDARTQRETAEKVLEHLRAERAATSGAGPVSDEDVSAAFHAEPEASRLLEEYHTARARLDAAQRIARDPNDPTIARARQRMQAARAQRDDLWTRRAPALRALLANEAGGEVERALRKAEAELLVLRARESALRERAERSQGDGVASRPGSGQGQALLATLRRNLEASEALRAELRRRFEDDLAQAQESEIDRLTERNLKAELERRQTMYLSVVEQLRQARLAGDYASVTARVVNPPSAAAVEPRRAAVLAVALALGCGLGLSLAFAAELLDDRLRTLPAIRKAFDLAVLGHIPLRPRDEDGAGGPVALLSHSRPRSLIAESCKSIRTHLELSRRGRRAQVLLITSPHSGDGKSTSASNLAISLAHAGRKVLLVDADLRRPSQHLIHDLDRDLGLTQVLENRVPVERVARPTAVANLDLIGAGPGVANPAELLSSPRFAEFLDTVRQSYDAILIDSSPLLAVTDPSIIGAAVDGIVLVVRATTITRHEAERTTELLKALGTPVLGTVINGITSEQSGYGRKSGYLYERGYGDGMSGAAEPTREGLVR